MPWGPWHHRPVGPGVHIIGPEPTRAADICDVLASHTNDGNASIVYTDLPGFDDDRSIRPYGPLDVRFRVRVPTADAVLCSSLCNRDLEELEGGMRNLRAFGFPLIPVVPVASPTIDGLAATIEHLVQRYTPQEIQLDVIGHGDVNDPSWAWSVTDAALERQLDILDSRNLRPRPRLRVLGRHGLRLPIDRLTRVDMRVEGGASDRDLVPAGHQHVHREPAPSGETLAARRATLVLPEKDRPAWRSGPADRLGDVVTRVLVRPGEPVFAVIAGRASGVPYLATTEHYGLFIVSRFGDDALNGRFRTLCKQVYAHVQAHPASGLGRLRELASILRRSMKPRHDDKPVEMREEQHH